MRLITRKLYRAFPELDRFSDERCEQFVRAARGGIVARTLRGLLLWGLMFLVFIGSVALVATGMGWIERRGVRWWDSGLEAAGMLVYSAVCFGLAPLAGFVGRDILLRGRVRRILRSHSSCARCEYRLLGLPMDAHHVVVCPECGHLTRVDPALAALAVDAAGRTHVDIADDVLSPWIMSAQAWRRVRWAAAWMFVIFVVIPGLAAGSWEWYIRSQASAARAAMSTPEQLLVLAAEMERSSPPGATLGLIEYGERLAERFQSMTQTMAEERVELSNGSSQLSNPLWRSPFRKRRWGQTADALTVEQADRQAELRMLDAARTFGIFQMIDELAKTPRLVRGKSRDEASSESQGAWASGATSSVYWPERRALAIALSQACVGAEQGDENELAAGLEATLAFGRAVRLRGAVYDVAWSMAADVMVVDLAISRIRERPSLEFADAIDRAIARQSREISSVASLEFARLNARDQVAMFVANTAIMRLGGLSPEARSSLGGVGPATKVPFWLGTLQQNLSDVDERFRVATARMALEPFERDSHPEAAAPLGPERPIAQANLVWLSGGAWGIIPLGGEMPQDRVMLRRRFWMVASALARYHVAHGAYPEKLADLGELLPVQPRDPWSGKKLLYRAEGAGYVLYSVGYDGADNGGVAKPVSGLQAVPGLDIVAGEN